MSTLWLLYCAVFVVGMTLYPVASKLSGGVFTGVGFALTLNVVNVLVLLFVAGLNNFADLNNIKQNMWSFPGLMIVLAGIAVGLSDVFFQKAMHFDIPAITQTVYTVLPLIFFSLIAYVLFKEQLTVAKLCGAVIAVGGVLIMIFSEGQKPG
jgi:drug/metabolite transporter (DMT)-like permease